MMPMRTIVVGLLLATAVVSAEDSPLVALAKRSNRTVSKTRVITNDTVGGGSRGRVSMSTGEAVPLPRTGAAPAPAAAPATPQAPPTPQAPATPQATTPPAASPYGTSTVRNVEPQSSARVIAPASSGRTIAPASTSRTIDATNAGRIDPQSTARNIQPQAVPPK